MSDVFYGISLFDTKFCLWREAEMRQNTGMGCVQKIIYIYIYTEMANIGPDRITWIIGYIFFSDLRHSKAAHVLGHGPYAL